MFYFFAALGRAMVDRNFSEKLEDLSQPTNRLARCKGLWDHLVEGCNLRLTRYEVMEVNRLVQRYRQKNYFKMVQARFPINSIQFPRDLHLCAALGQALVDQEFAKELHDRRTNRVELKSYLFKSHIDLNDHDAETVCRFFNAPATASSSKNLYQLLQDANNDGWVKPNKEPGQCAESMRYSPNYVHFSGPDFREQATQPIDNRSDLAQELLCRYGMDEVAASLESEKKELEMSLV